ncbi:MAG: hypothetical protein GX617_04320 [Lentisphaerae bacterium]|nr:hypothetical protein [Lentisphaerota bacterium]
MFKTCCACVVLLSLTLGAAVELRPGEMGPQLRADGVDLLVLSSPWVTNAAWEGLYQYPGDWQMTSMLSEADGTTLREHRGEHGVVLQKCTQSENAVTLRYEFDFADIADARNLQWVLQLRPDLYDGIMVSAETEQSVSPRSIERLSLGKLRQARLYLPTMDLVVEVSSADGEWRLSDQRDAAWAKCYRLEYNRKFVVDDSRKTWVEVTLRTQPVVDMFVPLTAGAEQELRALPFRLGAPVDITPARLSTIALWHSAEGPADKVLERGTRVGAMTVQYADREAETVPICWEEQVSAAGDDPRDLPDGLLAPGPDGRAAWLTMWRNPYPESPVKGITLQRELVGWRALAVTGMAAGKAPERQEAILAALRQTSSPGEAFELTLNGTWEFDPEGDKPAQDVPVPMVLEEVKGMGGVHAGTYRRSFDVPASFAGQRVLIHFDAVGDYCEVRVNGRSAGSQLVGPLPAAFDITGLVTAPSENNNLEVLIKDDTHFGVPKPSKDWRNIRHWVPRGIGTNARKGLFQSVSLRSRPQLHIADVRVQTSVREQRLTVIYELFNTQREDATVVLGGYVRPWDGVVKALELPEQEVLLPGLMLTRAEITVPWTDAVYWQPNQPQLYQLRSIIRSPEGQRLHWTDTRFGFREVWFEGIHFYLNGIRCNLRGESPSYHHPRPPLDTREDFTAHVKRALAANFNVLRFHAVPAPPHVYDVCDELGMMVIDESGIYASWGMILPSHPRWLPECREHLARWVRRDRNHPSVLIWSACNEALNCKQLSPAQLAEFARVIDSHDGTRPVIFDGDGSAYGVVLACNKHYVRTIADLEDHGGKASGYGNDLRDDIYWVAEYKQEVPMGIGEFLFPANDRLRSRSTELYACMGLQTRGYRYADWFDIRPYNPNYTGGLREEGPAEKFAAAWDIIVKSFAPVAVFDKAYDELGAYPAPPALAVGAEEVRTLIVYNDCFSDEQVTVAWSALLAGEKIAGGELPLRIELGFHTEVPISFTPPRAGDLELRLVSRKGGQEQFRDSRRFVVKAAE